LRYDVIVLGGGAAGLFCAAIAGQRGRRVIVLERSEKVGKKILISGGGRCNFTNIHTRAENFLSANPHFVKSALARYTPADFIRLAGKHRIPYHEKALGQLFCDRTSSDITGLLEAECAASRVTIRVNCRVSAVRRDTRFVVETDAGEYESEALVVSTGGLSIPRMGATDFGYRLARQFGHRIQPVYPALVPLTFDAEWLARYGDLSGVSTEVIATAGGQSFREKMLFTHRGLSGPAILQASSYWRKPASIVVGLVEERLPKRLAQRWAGDDPHRWELWPSGTEGYAKAEVTGGGVDAADLSSKTMESRLAPGLFFIGEVVDVTGHLGGFNFQWAWASGHAAGQAV